MLVIAAPMIGADTAMTPGLRTSEGHSNYEIAQTRDVVLIRAEMNNTARIIRIGGKHIDAGIGLLHGGIPVPESSWSL